MQTTTVKTNDQADPVLYPIIVKFTVDCGNNPIIKYDGSENKISSLKAGFNFSDYQTFFALGHLYAFKNGEDFHVQLFENMATIEAGAMVPAARRFNPNADFEHSGFALCFDKEFVYMTGGYKCVNDKGDDGDGTNEACKFELSNLSANTSL